MSDDKMFDYILARSRTRESSTLTVATVASSASLILLALYMQIITQPDFWLTQDQDILIKTAGCIFIVLGIAYRDFTALTIHGDDEHWLRHQAGITGNRVLGRTFDDIRSVLIRSLLLLPFLAWIYVVSSSTSITFITSLVVVVYIVIMGLLSMLLNRIRQIGTV